MKAIFQGISAAFGAFGRFLKSTWLWIVHWFEYGDLVPLLVLVSAVHYAAVLRGKDTPAVAIAIGMLVDLGHFRTIRAAFRYPGASTKRSRKPSENARLGAWVAYWLGRMTRRINGQLAARWFIAAVMTGISLAYHQRYYEDWWLSAPLPFLIAALAWLQKVDANLGTKRAAAATGKPATEKQPTAALRYICETCGYGTDNQRAFAAHSKKHKRAAGTIANQPHKNGKVIEPEKVISL